MRKVMFYKLLISTVLIAILLIIPTFVDAYSGEIDPKDYIDTPNYLQPKDDVYSGNIFVSNSVGSNYSLYYTSIELTESKYNEIVVTRRDEKNETIKKAKTEYEQFVAEAKLKIDKAEAEYEAIKNDSSKTEEEKKEAKEAYSKLVREYNTKNDELYSSYEEKVEQAKQKYYSYLPFSDNNWIQSSNKEVQIDVSKYAGDIYLILWVKLVNSEGTYYDYGMYSVNVPKNITLSLDKTTAEIKAGNTLQLEPTTSSNESITWTSDNEKIATVNSSGLVSGVAEGVATITAEVEGQKATCVVTVKKSTEQNEEDNGLKWTDFSSARITLKSEKYGELSAKYFVIVKGVNLLGKSEEFHDRYQMFVTTDKNYTPELEKEEGYKINDWIGVNSNKAPSLYDTSKELGIYITPEIYQQAGEKLYVWIREKQYNSNNSKFEYKYQMKAVEINRVPQWPLGTRISGFFTYEETSLILYDYYEAGNKTIKYKIGKITDKSILRSIKNGESGCLSELMKYAKNASNGYSGTAKTGQTDEIVSKLNLSNDEYYYVYMELDTENGKYYHIEDVSLYQAKYLSGINKWYLYNYLDQEFVWNLGEEPQQDNNTTVDNTISKDIIPNTGKTLAFSLLVIGVSTLGILGYKKMKEYYFIK